MHVKTQRITPEQSFVDFGVILISALLKRVYPIFPCVVSIAWMILATPSTKSRFVDFYHSVFILVKIPVYN